MLDTKYQTVSKYKGDKRLQNVKDIEEKVIKFHLFIMSASLQPSLGASTVRIIALKPFCSALFTNRAITFLLLNTYKQRITKL